MCDLKPVVQGALAKNLNPTGEAEESWRVGAAALNQSGHRGQRSDGAVKGQLVWELFFIQMRARRPPNLQLSVKIGDTSTWTDTSEGAEEPIQGVFIPDLMVHVVKDKCLR